jgi:hypothetical protein
MNYTKLQKKYLCARLLAQLPLLSKLILNIIKKRNILLNWTDSVQLRGGTPIH